jgi:exopolyphosphatase/pppGpp-phosphohydrolase
MIVGLLADVTQQKSILPDAVSRALEALAKIDLAAKDLDATSSKATSCST